MKTRNKDIGQLYETYHLKMIRLAWMLLGNREEAEDVVSEVFTKLLDNCNKVLPHAEEGYLMTAVRHRCANMVAHKSVKERVIKLIGDSKCMEQESQTDERLTSVVEFVRNHLPLLTQRIFNLRHIEGMSYQEIADKLSVSKVTVYYHLSEAVDQAKNYFKTK